MKLYTISANEAGQRFDKYLFKLFRNAPSNLLYKQLRCKNITLNQRKAKGNELLRIGDAVRVFMSDATIAKFTADDRTAGAARAGAAAFDVVYEDEHILLADKPAGVLSQKAAPDDVSMNEYLISYLRSNGMSGDSFSAFTPAFCNRLDRNTSGLMVGGKSLAGLQELSEMIRNRSLDKYYLAAVCGRVEKGGVLDGWLGKDERSNKVTVKNRAFLGSGRIVTGYEPVAGTGELTLLKLKLVTGKPHQLRAHLAFVGHPILGDPKYGDRAFNGRFRTSRQLLHSYEIVFPQTTGALAGLSGKSFRTAFPDIFRRFFDAEDLNFTADEMINETADETGGR